MLEMEIFLFVEGKEYLHKQYENLVEQLDMLNEVIKKNDGTFSFIITGFIIVNNIPVVIFPKNYLLPDSDVKIKHEAMVLMRVLMKYRLEKGHDPKEMDLLYGNTVNSTGRIISAISLIEDFQENGILKRKIRVDSSNHQGYIDWNATVNKTIPHISHKRPFYLKPIMRTSSVDDVNLLTQIHKYAVKESLDLWGWLFGYDDEEMERIQLPYSVEMAISYLNAELRKTFIQREIFVIKCLIDYLDSHSGQNKEKRFEVLATPFFNMTWEAICGYVYSNDYINLAKWVAQPIWDSNVIKKNISQRPDILFVDKSTFYILDAKYYDYNKTIPGWHDVVKQLFYKYTIEAKVKKSKELKVKKYENVLIFPENSDLKFTYLGRIYVEGVVDLGEVNAFAINTKEAMEVYALGRLSDARTILGIELCKTHEQNTIKRLSAYTETMQGN